MAEHGSHALTNPAHLKPVDESQGILQVIVETPKGSRNKYAFDAKQKVFTLRKVLPAGMVFPYDFGFLPQTLAQDGDPLDVLLLMDEPAFPGVVVRALAIGIIEGEQREGDKKVRNDRLLAVAEASHLYSNIRQVSDLPERLMHEIEEFFVNYYRLEGKQYTPLGSKDAGEAERQIEEARRAA